MADRNVSLGVTTDEASINNGKKRLAELQRAQEKLAAAQAKYANDSSKAGKAINEGITKQLKELEKEEKQVQRAIENTNKAFLDQQTASNRAAKGVEAAQTASTRRRGGLPVGGESVSPGKQLADIGRNIRYLPSVQVPGAGIGTDTFGRAAEVLGKLGVSTQQLAVGAGVTTVALGAVAVAFHLAAQAAREQAQVLNSVIEANRKVGQDVAQGLTTEQAEKRVAELERLAAQEQKILNENTAARESALNDLSKETNIGRDTLGLADGLAGLIPQVGTLNTQIDTSKSTIEGYNTEINSLTSYLEDGTIAANDAAAAEKALAEARTAGVLREAEQAGELASLKERAAELTQEQIDSELKSLEIRKAGLEAELAALEASGNTSEEVAKKISELRESIGFLGEQSDVLKNARRTARSSEADKAAEKAAKEAEKEREKAEKDRQRATEKSQNDAAKAQENYADAVRDAGQKFTDALEDIDINLGDKFIDNQRDFQDDLNEMSIKFNEGELKEERDFQRDLARIRRDATDAEKDAIRQRDFAAAADARDDAVKALEERRDDEAADNAEQLIEFQQAQAALGRERDLALRDAQIDADRARRDAAIARDRSIRDAQAGFQQRAQMEGNFQQNSLKQWDGYFKQIINMQRQALGGGQGSSTSTRTNRSSFSSGVSADELQYMTG